jgi:tripartite ATP-independent transporter DctM subunit
MLTFWMLFALVAFILLGAPIGFVMAILPTVYIAVTDVVPLTAVPYQMYTSLNKFPLVAVPMFLLAGELMNLGAVTDRLLHLSREIVGRIRGGLSHITIVMSMLFASLNGSAVASTATIGGIMIPAMKKAGYSAPFSAATTAVSSTIGGIIPPSIAIVIFASANNLSVGKLFSAGILPGITVGLLFMLVAYVISVRRNYERLEEPFRVAVLLRAFVRALLALSLPVILYFGIVGGIFTATEAGAVVCFLAFVIGKFIYRTLTWADVLTALRRTVRMSAAIFIIIAAAGPFSWLLTRLGALQGLEAWLLQFQANPVLFVVAFLAVIVIAGMLADIVANLIILGPTLLVAAAAAGMSETQASMVICVGFLLGTVTPPVGICFFAAARIAGDKLERVAVAMLPFIAMEFVLLLLIILFPPLTQWIPKLAGFEV